MVSLQNFDSFCRPCATWLLSFFLFSSFDFDIPAHTLIQKDNVRQALVKNILLVEFIIIISFKIIEWYVRSVTIIYLQCNKHNDE